MAKFLKGRAPTKNNALEAQNNVFKAKVTDYKKPPLNELLLKS
jgi:hypothetical protein